MCNKHQPNKALHATGAHPAGDAAVRLIFGMLRQSDIRSTQRVKPAWCSYLNLTSNAHLHGFTGCNAQDVAYLFL